MVWEDVTDDEVEIPSSNTTEVKQISGSAAPSNPKPASKKNIPIATNQKSMMSFFAKK